MLLQGNFFYKHDAKRATGTTGSPGFNSLRPVFARARLNYPLK